MNTKLHALALAALLTSTITSAASLTLPVPIRGTFLHTDSNERFSEPPIIVDLQALGIFPGQTVLIESLGGYSQNYVSYPDGSANQLIGVFSSSADLGSQIADGPANIKRVLGAIYAGSSIVTPNTLHENDLTDIAEDFSISGAPPLASFISISVPASAKFLFVGVVDSFYEDNRDFNDDFKVRISSISAVPEPSTSAFFLAGLLALQVLKNRRSASRSGSRSFESRRFVGSTKRS